jgi:hypothetical protein
MTMYPQPLVESLVAVGEVRARLQGLAVKVYGSVDSDDDDVFNELIESLANVQSKLMTLGTEVYGPEVSNFRKVTLETGPTA